MESMAIITMVFAGFIGMMVLFIISVTLTSSSLILLLAHGIKGLWGRAVVFFIIFLLSGWASLSSFIALSGFMG